MPEGHRSPAADDRVRRLETHLAGLALRAAGRLGTACTAPVLDHVLDALARTHPRAVAALRELPAGGVLIDPVDQPVAVLLTVGPRPRLRLARRETQAEAAIRGPLPALLDLLEGRIDGDALFFRRTLRIEGDTALVVALRNALDGEEIDLVGDVAAAAGPLRHAVPRLRREAARLLGALDGARGLLLAPVLARLDALERRVNTRPGREA
ncbi:ubiquinone anaerobic biosynthesis accessory factor UbiT [Azospirillum sp. ST 5-10]|uniref:ubiquinone anaerobic biosynthesis accessory factor UbiT n=1 Tax=unclassified Azospirillum TaxID=2630922 RepID=UPI003F4A7BD7